VAAWRGEVGIRGHERGAQPIKERARIVIGADGVNSFVSRAVRAPRAARQSGATNAFLSAITGAIPLPDFMSADNIGRIIAAAGAVDAFVSKPPLRNTPCM
jgi:2-polyprenyl-6-methoxyphenol hydroxylase-like FAD-dependent oxidoreductase